MAKKIITVVGATGGQGGSVAQTFLDDATLKSQWTVRGVTRNTSSEKAQALVSKGAEVVSADVNDKESLVKAFAGSEAVFALTNYWEKADMDLEIQQGKNMADAAKEADVKLFIWSTLPNVTKISNGKLPHVYHFDSKAQVEEYVRSLGIPAAFFMPGFYMSNLPGGMFRPSPPDNSWTFGLPVPGTAKIPMFDAQRDTGKYVKGIVLAERDAVLGRQIPSGTAYMTGDEVVAAFKKAYPVAGESAKFFHLPDDMFRGAMKGMGRPDFIVEEMLENMHLLEAPGYYGGESLDFGHSLLKDKLTTWEEHMQAAPAFKDLK